VTIEPLKNIANLPLFEVRLEDVRLTSDDVVGWVAGGSQVLSTAVTKAAVLQTAFIVGAAHAVLEMTNQYAKDRRQFGRPIGSYQSVQNMVSDILIDLHTIDLLGRQAAYLISVGLPYEEAAEIAIIHGKSQAAHFHRQAHEVFAGIAFMSEHPLHHFSLRSKYLENNYGDVRYHYSVLAGIICA